MGNICSGGTGEAYKVDEHTQNYIKQLEEKIRQLQAGAVRPDLFLA